MKPSQIPLSAITIGYCACGCGQKTPIATRNRPDLGWVKGQPVKYMRGHNHRYRGGPEVPFGMKWCGRCQKIKPISEFFRNRASANGLQSRCKSCVRELVSEYRHKKPFKDKQYGLKYRLRKKYGIGLDQYNTLLEAQGNVCAICGKSEKGIFNGSPKIMAVDHNHQTGEIRGILCSNCNGALGMIGDDIAILKKAIIYLNR